MRMNGAVCAGCDPFADAALASRRRSERYDRSGTKRADLYEHLTMVLCRRPVSPQTANCACRRCLVSSSLASGHFEKRRRRNTREISVLLSSAALEWRPLPALALGDFSSLRSASDTHAHLSISLNSLFGELRRRHGPMAVKCWTPRQMILSKCR
jgi:hypothetical protein